MNLCFEPGRPLRGEVTLPGDKSLSHRVALFAALAQGESRAENFLVSGVTDAMLRALTALGVEWQLHGTCLTVAGRGLAGLRTPAAHLNCGNSATTLRLLAGALAASGIEAVLDGSGSLRRRPMDRIIEPLGRMGVRIEAGDGGTAPLRVAGRPRNSLLRAIDYTLPVASAQVKTCLILAALAGDGPSKFVEPSLSRDHSERMLSSMGAKVRAFMTEGGPAVEVHPLTAPLSPVKSAIPGDFSAAAFLIVAALIVPGSEVVLRNVGLNPTRTGLLVTLQEMGADIEIFNPQLQSGEPAGDLRVRAGPLRGAEIHGARVVEMIDEFPAFAVVAALAQGRSQVHDATELRYKESDRIGMLCAELRAQGAQIEEQEDGFIVVGRGEIAGGEPANPHGDHRLAMSLAVLGMGASRPVTVHGAEITAESFPDFIAVLESLGARNLCASD